jgi:uncharacterized membrane protein
MRRFAMIATAAVLAACQPPAPANNVTDDPANAPAPVPAANTIAEPAPDPTPPAPSQAQTDYRSEMRLTGTEPFWGVHITSGQIKLMRPDHADVTVTNAGPTINGDVAVWNARGLTIRLEPGECSDGMSNNTYPYKATVTVDGETLRGCAARADQWPRGEG